MFRPGYPERPEVVYFFGTCLIDMEAVGLVEQPLANLQIGLEAGHQLGLYYPQALGWLDLGARSSQTFKPFTAPTGKAQEGAMTARDAILKSLRVSRSQGTGKDAQVLTSSDISINSTWVER